MVNMRPFNEFERNNVKFLVNHNVKFTQVQITPTGLKKGILDATIPMRTYFLEKGIHSYENQLQGQEHKAIKNAIILSETGIHKTTASFYRPLTKKGDPRMWIYGISAYSCGDDIHILFWHESALYTINITRINIERCYNSVVITPLQDVLKDIFMTGNSVCEELLGKFKSVKDEWFESEVLADTGIGRTIESFLNIKMNSSKAPDYKGIELKSHREKRSSKKNVLFTKTPDWDISVLKSGKEIVARFGYNTPNGVKTYQNTVQCASANSQGLILNVDYLSSALEINHISSKKTEDVVLWRLINLHSQLLSKHKETFWIEVENVINDGKEYFRYKKIEHTKNPVVEQFDVLLEQSLITVDLLLSRPSGHGDCFLFKIKPKGMPLLFPDATIYIL